jgi:triosephosphate isomerase
MKRLIAGNWKMNGTRASLAELARRIDRLRASAAEDVEIAICPPATLITEVVRIAHPAGVCVGAQDCHPEAFGAYTGDVSAEMLKDAGCDFVIVGHSERRAGHGETDAFVRAKAKAALRAGLAPIVCVGETAVERRNGAEFDVVGAQLQASLPEAGAFVVAYEPVWAIGTGLTPDAADIVAMHGFIRERTGHSVRILYGGSVKSDNAAEILRVKNVDGALVGGASLDADEFSAIIRAA